MQYRFRSIGAVAVLIRARSALVAVGIVMAACTPSSSAEAPPLALDPEWGRCDVNEWPQEGFRPLSEVFSATHIEWIEIPAPVAGEAVTAAGLGESNALRVPSEVAVLIKGVEKPEAVDISPTVIESVKEAVALGAGLLIGYPAGNPVGHGGTTDVAALMESTDRVVFLAPCAYTAWTEPLAAAAEGWGSSSAVEFTRQALDPATPEGKWLAERIPPIADGD